MLIREYVEAGHTTRFSVRRGTSGWEVSEERDDRVVKHVSYHDWHRVERAMLVFEQSHAAANLSSQS